MSRQNLSRPEIEAALYALAPMTYYGTLAPAETVYWRSPHAALASVTDFRKGAMGDQQHVWQATLNGSAMVFTTHPGPNIDGAALIAKLARQLAAGVGLHEVNITDIANNGAGARRRGSRAPRSRNDRSGGSGGGNAGSGSVAGNNDYSDGYWTGSASLPRIGQLENVALILYRPPPTLYIALRTAFFPFNYTHAGFRRDQFDELADELAVHGRIAGRVGQGYIALWSASPNVSWMERGDNAGREIVAPTDQLGRGVWACMVGDQASHGSFSNWTDAVLRTATLTVDYGADMETTLS